MKNKMRYGPAWKALIFLTWWFVMGCGDSNERHGRNRKVNVHNQLDEVITLNFERETDIDDSEEVIMKVRSVEPGITYTPKVFFEQGEAFIVVKTAEWIKTFIITVDNRELVINRDAFNE